MEHPSSGHGAREYFPRGLIQPPGSFRFSADALLLAAFALRRSGENAAGPLLDLGCGCGVVALACLLAARSLTAHGIDCQPELVAAARGNADLLGLTGRFSAEVLDLALPFEREKLLPRSIGIITANMPYRQAGSGRPSPSASRQKALFADEQTVPSFLQAAAHALVPGGNLFLVYPWKTKDGLVASLARHGFSVEEIVPVHTARGMASRCLIRALNNGSGEGGVLSVREPLVLHAGNGGEYTREALAFCPWLASRPWGGMDLGGMP